MSNDMSSDMSKTCVRHDALKCVPWLMHMWDVDGGKCETWLVGMGWLRVVGSLESWVSFAKEPYKRDDILQQRPMILRRLLIVATPYAWHDLLSCATCVLRMCDMIRLKIMSFTCRTVMSHTWMRHITHINESRHTNATCVIRRSRGFRRIMSHICRTNVGHMVRTSCHAYQRVMSHICIHQCLTYAWVTAHIHILRNMRRACVWHDSWVWRDSFICVMWRIHLCDMTVLHVCAMIRFCDMTHLYVWRDAFICITWLSCMCVTWFVCATWLIYMCDVTHLYVWHDSNTVICVTWRIYMYDMTPTQSHVW